MITEHGRAARASRQTSPSPLRLFFGVLASALALATVAVSAHAAPGSFRLPELRFATPSTVVLSGKSTRVVVRTPASYSGLRVTVSGNDLSKRVKRISPTRLSITLRRGKDVAAGSNNLIVSLRAKGAKRRSIGSTRVIVLRKQAALRSASVSVSGGSHLLKLRLKREPLIFRVELNGRSVGNLVSRHLPTQQTAKLSPDDGLKFGRNVLRIRAVAKDGSHSSRVLAFNVSKKRPLAAAGRDRRLVATKKARLSGENTRFGGLPAKYQWRLKKAPKGSKAKLSGSQTSRPSIKPDVNGRYEIQLTATAGGRAGTDTVVLKARAVVPPMGVALDTLHQLSGGDYSIRVGGSCGANVQGCQPTDYPFGSNAVQLLVIDRETLDVQTKIGYDGTALSALTAALYIRSIGAETDPDVFVVLAAKPGAATDPTWTGAIENLMGKNASLQTNGGWSAVGVPVPAFEKVRELITGIVNPGESPEAGAALGDQRGWFQWDSIGQRYAYVSGRYASYDTASGGDQVTSNVMRINGQTYASSPLAAGCSGGFQVVALRAVSLDPVTSFPANQTFSTNCSDSGDSVGGATDFTIAMNFALDPPSPVGGDGPAVVFVQSIGQPSSSDPNLRAQFVQAAVFIEQLGGQAEVFNRAMTASDSRYALVGGSNIVGDQLPIDQAQAHGAEATALNTPKGAVLSGVLRGNHRWNYEPVSAVGSGSLGTELTPIVYQPAQPWPYSTTSGEQNALAYISKVYNLQYSADSSCYEPAKPDVRFEYCDLTAPWAKISSDLGSAKYTSACGCSTTDWSNVTGTISAEAGWVVKVQEWVGQIQKLYGGPGTTTARIGLKGIANTINQAINPPAGSGASGWWTDLVSNVLGAVALLPEEDAVANVISAVSAIGYLAEDALTTPSGVSSLGAIVSETAADLPGDLANKYLDASERLGAVSEILVSDYGKLKAAGSSTLIQVDDTALNNSVSTMLVGAYRFGYAKMLNSAYSSYALPSGTARVPGRNIVDQFACSVPNQFGGNDFLTPFVGSPTDSWLALDPNNPPSPYFNNAAPIAFVLAEKGASGTGVTVAPPSGILPNIFSPITFDSTGAPKTLGEYAPWWFRQQYPATPYVCP